MTAHLTAPTPHEIGRSYRISAREAARWGLPVIKIERPPVLPGPLKDPRRTAATREGRLYRMARDIRAARDRGVRQGCLLIALKVAYRSGLTLSEMKATCRERDLVAARHRAFYGMHKGTRASLPVIGRFFGMDHTSILHGIAKHAARLAAQGRR